MKHRIVRDDQGNPTSVSVFLADEQPRVARSDHPNFREIVEGLEQNRPQFEVLDMFDIGSRLARGFRAAKHLIERIIGISESQEPTEGSEEPEGKVDLAPIERGEPIAPPSTDVGELALMKQRELQTLAHSLGIGSVVGKSNDWIRAAIKDSMDAELVEVANKVTVTQQGRVFYDGELIEGGLADALLAYHKQGGTNYVPLIRFVGKVMANPEEHSRKMLYGWLSHLSFHIHVNGNIIAYKGVAIDRDPKVQFRSATSSGHAFVDGVEHNGYTPHPIGAVVHMPREEVRFDPRTACAPGLHVGTVSHASSYGSAMIEVEIDPVDVVSVPEYETVKMRVCRYTVRRKVNETQIRELANAVSLRDL